MTSFAYELEDRFSARAARHKNLLGHLCKGLAVLFAIIGDTAQSLGGDTRTH